MKNNPAFKAAILLMTGILAGYHIRLCMPLLLVLLGLLASGLISLILLQRLQCLHSPLLIVTLIIIGMIRIHCSRLIPCRHIINTIAPDRIFTCTGTLVQDPVHRGTSSQFVMETDSILHGSGRQTCGRLLVKCNGTIPFLRYGDKINLKGTWSPPSGRRNPGGFDYRAYLRIRDIHGIMRPSKGSVPEITGIKGNILLKCLIYPLRRRIRHILQQTTSGQATSILLALLLGDKSELDSDIREAFARAGIVHILAVSGLHTGFVCGFLLLFFGCLRLSTPVQVFLTIGGLIIFALLTEANPPVVRAACMASLYLIGTLLQRRPSPFNILGVTALFFLLVNPKQLFSPGFQFSYSAVLSIFYFYPKLTLSGPVHAMLKKAGRIIVFRKLLQLSLISLSASLGTLPFTAIYYNQIPTLFIITNLFAIPLAGLIVNLGFLTVFCSLIHPWVAAVYGSLSQFLILTLIKLTTFFSHIPCSSLAIKTPSLLHIAIYFSIIFLLLPLHDRWRKFWMYALCGVLNIFIWNRALQTDRRQLIWTQLDVGQGDAAVLQLPNRKNLLIDCGDKTPYFDTGRQVIIPFLHHRGIRHLHAVFITHPHNDHIGGLLSLMDHFTIDRLYVINSEYHSALFSECRHKILDSGIACDTLYAGDAVYWDQFVRIKVLSPPEHRSQSIHSTNLNSRSLVLRLLYGRNALLFMGDAEKDVEKRLLASGIALQADAIKIGHHGSRTSSTLRFLQAVRPDYAVVSVGRKNRFNHPSAEVIQRLQKRPGCLLRTDHRGAVIIMSNGDSVSRQVWR